jgi:hypothetical protein
MRFGQQVIPQTLLVTIAATGVPQPLSATTLKVKMLAVERVSGSALIGDASNQVLSSLTINGGAQWVDLASIYVKGDEGDEVGVFYSDTYCP